MYKTLRSVWNTVSEIINASYYFSLSLEMGIIIPSARGRREYYACEIKHVKGLVHCLAHSRRSVNARSVSYLCSNYSNVHNFLC